MNFPKLLGFGRFRSPCRRSMARGRARGARGRGAGSGCARFGHRDDTGAGRQVLVTSETQVVNDVVNA